MRGVREPWSLDSWRSKPAEQQPEYAQSQAKTLADAEQRLRHLPPLVGAGEVLELRQQLREVWEGKRFLLQGGDCAERFLDCRPGIIENKLKILLQMSLVITYAAKIPTVRIGRIAGQYPKPRSSPFENVNGAQVPSFRGDCINDFDCSNREHDPKRLVEAYFHSTATLNYIRSLTRSGFASLRNSGHWDLGYVSSEERKRQYKEIVDKILDCLHFIETAGMKRHALLDTVDFFTSHEALVLLYESALTRKVDGQFFDLSAHFVWIGDRTRQLDHAHVEFLRGIANPIGIKMGPSFDPASLASLVLTLNPENSPGKIVLITRLGAQRVVKFLPKFVQAAKEAQLNVIWCCDPMHGNTTLSKSGFKTRLFENIFGEIVATLQVHRELGSRLGGLHLELTGEDVTECIGGPQDIGDHDLHHRYTTYCDPRLNYAQSMEVAFLLASALAEQNKE